MVKSNKTSHSAVKAKKAKKAPQKSIKAQLPVNEKAKESFSPKVVGLSLGFLGSIAILSLALGNLLTGRVWAGAVIRTISSMYIGYDVSFRGIIVGMVWAYVDFFVTGYIFAWIYKKLSKMNL